MPRSRSIAASWSTRIRDCPVRLTSRILLVSSLILVNVFLGSSGRGEIIDRIAAIVNEDIITLSDVEKLRESFYRSRLEENDWLSKEFDLLDARLVVLNTLIEEKLVDQEANRLGIRVTEKQVKDAVESFRKQRGWSQSQLEMALQAEGLTREDYREEVVKGLKRNRLVNRVIKSDIEIEEEDIRTYYETHLNDYLADESIRISHILLPCPPNPTQENEEALLSMAKDILKRVKNGEDFAALAHEYSQTTPGVREGDLGSFKKGEMIPTLENIAFSLRVGEVGGPIRTPEGVVLIKVTDKKGANPIPLAKIRKRVEKDCYSNEAERRYRQWLNKLKKRAFIEVKL